MALLPWEPDQLAITKRAYHVMCSSLIYLDPVMRVKNLIERIRFNIHHAFPVVDGPIDHSRFSYGTLIGLIPTEHLALILEKRVSNLENNMFWF